jgi:ubiquinone/menaquinone biosynthesis C-methylase UbiE
MPMGTVEQEVARHYGRGDLESVVLDGVKAAGHNLEDLRPEDLAPVDEFHIGGVEATAALAERLGLAPGTRVLDIGCGIGGPARFFASRHGCRVVGIDLTPEFVAAGTALTRRVGLADRVELRVGSALDLPVNDGTFDAATLLHVGMNVPDKGALCAAAHRALRPGGSFAVYDVMRVGEGELGYPVPWAATAATSFVETPETYRRALTAAGFAAAPELVLRDMALDFFRRMRARAAETGPPALGLHQLMGPDAAARVANMVAAIERGVIAPVEIIAKRG